MVGSPASATTRGHPSGTCCCSVAASSARSGRAASWSSSTVRTSPARRLTATSTVAASTRSRTRSGVSAAGSGRGDGDLRAGAQDRRSRRHPLHPEPPPSGCARHELPSGFEPVEQLAKEARARADLDAHREPTVELRRDRGDLAQQDGLSHSSGTHQHQRSRGATVERGHLQRLADRGQRLVPARQHPGRLVEAWAVGVGLPIHPLRLAGSSTSSEKIDL